MNVPNTITMVRIGLAIITVSLLKVPSDVVRIGAFLLTALIIWADGLDGYFARKLNQSTQFGAMLDIAGDRMVEMAYWIAFAVLHWIGLTVPLIFLVRGTLVDVIRACEAEKGHTAFGANTMMQTPLGKFLVASNFSRFTYAVVKAMAFCLVIVAHTKWAGSHSLLNVANFFVNMSVAFCIIRGLPVLLEAGQLFRP